MGFQLGFTQGQPVSSAMPPPSPSASAKSASRPDFFAGDHPSRFRINPQYIPRNADEMQPIPANRPCLRTFEKSLPNSAERPFHR